MNTIRHHRSVGLGIGLITLILVFRVFAAEPGVTSFEAQPEPSKPKKQPDVIYVPTPQEVVDKMLELAEVKRGDIVYDLGCGDGRIVVTAAKKFGVKATGVDIDPQRVKEARDNVKTNGVSHLVTIKEADIFELDFSDATVVTLYLLPELNVRLMPKLAKLKPGTRIVSNDFDMRGAKPKLIVNMPGTYDSEFADMHRTIYKWVVPWEPEPKKD